MSYKVKYKVFLFCSVALFIGMFLFSFTKPSSVDFAEMLGIGKMNINYSEITTFGAISTTTGLTDETLKTEITELVENYYAAKQAVDMDELSKYVSNIDNVQQKKFLTEAEYVEGYSDFNCMIVNVDRGSYRVYANYYVKIYNVDTLIPSLSALFIKEDKDDNLKVYLGALTSEEIDAITTLDGLDIVKDLSSKVQNELSYVVQNDEQVKNFYKMLQEKTEADSEEESDENIDNEAVFETEKPKNKKKETEETTENNSNKKKNSDSNNNKKNKKKKNKN